MNSGARLESNETALMKNQHNRTVLLVLTILLVPWIYFLLVGRYGWSDQDDGYMLGFAWHVFHGKLPYRDFSYVLPPVSPFLHSVWFRLLSPKFLYAGTRLAALYEVWIASLTASFTLCRYCFVEHDTLNRNWVGVALGAFLFSVCGLTPMPWYTFDGIFFGALGACVLISWKGAGGAAIAGLLIVLSAGTKQSFYPLIVFSLLYLLLSKRTRDFFVLALSMSFFAGLIALALDRYGMMANFRMMTSGCLRLSDALNAGLFRYLSGTWFFGRKLIALVVAIFLLSRLFKKPFRMELVAGCYFLAIVLTVFHRWSAHPGFVALPDLGFTQLLFLVALIYGLWIPFHYPARRNEALGFLLFLSLSWCASISMGWLAPIMFSAPLLVGGYLCLSEFSPGHNDHLLSVGAVGIVAVAVVASIFPYQDLDGRLHDHIDLGSIDKHFSFIISGPKTAEKLTEFKALRQQFAGSFVTLPAFGWSYIVADRDNPIECDWPQNILIGAREPLLEAQLDHRVEYVFLDKSFTQPPASSQWAVPLIGYVSTYWTPVHDGNWYRVYRNER